MDDNYILQLFIKRYLSPKMPPKKRASLNLSITRASLNLNNRRASISLSRPNQLMPLKKISICYSCGHKGHKVPDCPVPRDPGRRLPFDPQKSKRLRGKWLWSSLLEAVILTTLTITDSLLWHVHILYIINKFNVQF